MIAWNDEAFARTKRLKPLSEYIGRPRAANRDAGAATLRAMIARMRAMEESGSGS